MIRYSTLLCGKYLPDSYFSAEPLINPSEFKTVGNYYGED